MKKKFEYLIYLILFVLFGTAFIQQSTQSEYYLYYTISLWLSTGLIFAITRFIVAPRFMNKKIYVPLTILVTGIVISYLAPAYTFVKYQSDITDINANAALILNPIIIKELVPYILVASIIGFIYLINIKKNTVKKALLYFSATIIVAALIFTIKYFTDASYEGNDSIQFIKEEYNTLNDLLKKEEFSNKVVYIDLWYSSCSPCIKEFKKLPDLKEELTNNNVEFLYMARQTSHPNSLQLWKNAIKKYNLKGWHVYMTDELRENTWKLIEEHTKDSPPAYPHYLLVNEDGKIVSFNANRPSDGQLLIDQIKELTIE